SADGSKKVSLHPRGFQLPPQCSRNHDSRFLKSLLCLLEEFCPMALLKPEFVKRGPASTFPRPPCPAAHASASLPSRACSILRYPSEDHPGRWPKTFSCRSPIR